MSPPRVLTVAGSDPSGGAGIQADLKTFARFGCYGMAVVTALTAQNTVGVRAVHAPPPSFVAEQLRAVVDDCAPVATKTGMLFSAGIVAAVAGELRGGLLVVDPVMVATSGDRLLQTDAETALVELLLPGATLVTPNAAEAAALSGEAVQDDESALRAARRILELGPAAVLVKGGHVVAGPGAGEARDVLVQRSGEVRWYVGPRVPVAAPHGTGCTLSAAIAAGLARGRPLEEAVGDAKAFVERGLRAAFAVGAGGVPLNHLVAGPDGPVERAS